MPKEQIERDTDYGRLMIDDDPKVCGACICLDGPPGEHWCTYYIEDPHTRTQFRHINEQSFIDCLFEDDTGRPLRIEMCVLGGYRI